MRRVSVAGIALLAALLVPAGALGAGTAKPSALRGTWKKTLPATKNNRKLSQVGKWQLRLKAKTYVLDQDSALYIPNPPQKITYSTRRVVFTDAQPRENDDCKRGSYRWRIRGRKLTFTLVKDRCEARRNVLTRGAWTRSP